MLKNALRQLPSCNGNAVITQAKQEQPQMSIRQLCRSLKANRRWYYTRLAQGDPADPDVELRDAIEQIILEFAGYGFRRVTYALVRVGWSVNHMCVLRIMREESLLCHLKRQFVPTTDSHHPFQVYPYLVKGLQWMQRMCCGWLKSPTFAW